MSAPIGKTWNATGTEDGQPTSTLNSDHPCCRGVRMVTGLGALPLGLGVPAAALPVFGVGKERVVATAIWQHDAKAVDPPPIFLYNAFALHAAAVKSGGTDLSRRNLMDRLRKLIVANQGGFWLPPDRAPKKGLRLLSSL